MITGAFCVLLLVGCSTTPAPTATPPTVVTSDSYRRDVEYVMRVEGTARSADVTYTSATGTSQATVQLPLTNKAGNEGIRFTQDNVPDFLYISAQNTGAVGEVRCSIEVDGVVVSQAEATNAYGICSCDYSP